MSVKNGDLPAMPITAEPYPVGAIPTSTIVASGLTKREQFAMNAPDAVPIWFIDMNKELTARERFFRWRSYYADMMLTELERTK